VQISATEVVMKILNLISNNLSNHFLFYIMFEIAHLKNYFLSAGPLELHIVKKRTNILRFTIISCSVICLTIV
jgi:hypothetical protein